MTEPMECTICYENFNKRTRYNVNCIKCEKSTCRECVKKYLLSTLKDPHCMHCNHPWDVNFLNQNLPQSFLKKEYKCSRSDLLFKREQSFFPEAMTILEKMNKKNELLNRLAILKKEQQKILHEIWNLDNCEEKTKNNEPKNIRSCSGMNCKGFINSKGKCPICNKETCMKCNTIKNENHECQDSDVETWNLIIKSSKPCPNCSTRIQKSQGCAQMWCPGCHKAFNWNTGKIEKGPIHNPHFYEYSEKLGLVNPQNFYCNDVWNIHGYNHKNDPKFNLIHRRINHIVHIDLPRIQARTERNNIDLRIRYLKNEMDETLYKKMLIRREKSHQKYDRLYAICQTIQTGSAFFLNELKYNKISLDQFFIHIGNLDKFTNDSIHQLNETFSSKIKCSNYLAC